MDAFTAVLRRERATRALLPLFFVSGATGLAYQALWARRLHLVLGTSTLAVTTVLAAFMAGLALGGFWMARVADRQRIPLRVYGLLEVWIGVFGLAFPWLLRAITPLWVAFGRSADPSPLVLGLVQFLLVGSVLVIPTALMGATLPLLARFATDRLGAAGERVGLLYGVNTAGAVFGTWFTGFVLLPAVGWGLTNTLAAMANLLLGAAALSLASWAHGAERAPVEVDYVPVGQADRRVLLAAFLAGLAALACEVAWTRVVGLVIGGSAYAFSLMLLAFLSGIALGGYAGGPIADRMLSERGFDGLLRGLAAIELTVAGLCWGTLFLFPELPFLFVRLFDAWDAATAPAALWTASLAVAGLVMLPPTVGMGMAFPVAARALVRDPRALGGPVGRLYGANTLGSLVGAFVGGFVLVPTVGLRGTVAFAVVVLCSAAALLAWRVADKVLVGAVVLAIAAAFVPTPWDPMMMTAGLYKYVSSFDDHSRAGIREYTHGSYELVSYEEGLGSVVTVVRNTGTGNLWLANNGKVDASSGKDMPTQVMLAAAPLHLAKAPRDVLVIGLASGATAGAAGLVPTVEHIDVAEIEPAVVRAARRFSPYNWQILDDPRTRIHVADGRQVLLVAKANSWDVVISEPPNPWITGVSNLFTREFFELGRSRVRPGGVWAQWIQMYAMDTHDLQTLLATFASVWPHVAIFATPTRNDLVVVGSEAPLHPGPPAAERPFDEWPALGEALRQVGIGDPEALTALYVMDRAAVLGFTAGARLNTDDNLRVEYRAPLSLHRPTSEDNSAATVQWRRIPWDAYDDDPDGLAALARAYRQREDWARAILALREAASMVPRSDSRHAEWTEAAETWKADLVERLRD